jgi:hypothetical protein
VFLIWVIWSVFVKYFPFNVHILYNKMEITLLNLMENINRLS